MTLDDLLDIGFFKVGYWFLGDNISGLDFKLSQSNTEKKVLYAFVENNIIHYIGKTDNTLEKRMNGYKNAGCSQRTNIRVQSEIKNLLKSTKQIEIYCFVDKSNYKHKWIKIRLSAGIEDNLIESFKPTWNYRSNKKTKIKETLCETIENENSIVDINLDLDINKIGIKTFSINTNEVRNGRINFPRNVINYDLLPSFGSIVTVYLGTKNDSFFQATLIDSGNGNARINKTLLKSWYTEEGLENQKYFNLDIINKTTFRIYK